MAMALARTTPHLLSPMDKSFFRSTNQRPTQCSFFQSPHPSKSHAWRHHMSPWRQPTTTTTDTPSAMSELEEGVLIPTKEDEDEDEQSSEYDWKEEWYPLYLTKEVPDDAPLGLTVFDRQLVLYKDGAGVVRCYEDRCPHRLAKLSEGQLVDGRLECLYHGWQFEGDGGKCVRIPQLPEGAKIPNSACARTYKIKDSQGVIWVWMSTKTPPDTSKLPFFKHYSRPGFQHASTIHELPYDHSILLENFMDPAHVPISHDRTDFYSKREDSQPLLFTITERSHRGFAGTWSKSRPPVVTNFLRFQAPCVLQNNHKYIDGDGRTQYVSALFLCRPTGQGRSMVIMRFGTTKSSPVMRFFPSWLFHQNIGKVLEQDMGFLSSQNEVLMKEKKPVKDLYLNLKSSDTWVAEYRKWMDKVGHGMPYYFGHSAISIPTTPAVIEQAPAGLVAAVSASMPAKGGFGEKCGGNPMNRYSRHVVHCKDCRNAVMRFGAWTKVLTVMAMAAFSAAIVASGRWWKVFMLVSVAVSLAGAALCNGLVSLLATNFIREHRRL